MYAASCDKVCELKHESPILLFCVNLFPIMIDPIVLIAGKWMSMLIIHLR